MSESKPEEVKAQETKPLSDEDKAKVKKQIEFYFSDSNYPKDKFLLETAKKHTEGYIPLSILASFNRLKAITTDLQQIQLALGDSDVVVLNDDKTLIKRKHPVPENLNADSRTLYITGVPTSSTLDELEKFFSNYGTVNSIRQMKDKKTRVPNGTLFLELASEEEAKKMVETKDITLEGAKLHVKTREQSLIDQKKSLLKKRAQPEQEELSYEKGLIVNFKGLAEGNDINALTLKDFLKTQADVAYVEYSKGDVEGFARCANTEEASKLCESKAPFNDDVTFTYSILEGENEKMYWVRASNGKKSRNTRVKKRRKY